MAEKPSKSAWIKKIPAWLSASLSTATVCISISWQYHRATLSDREKNHNVLIETERRHNQEIRKEVTARMDSELKSKVEMLRIDAESQRRERESLHKAAVSDIQREFQFEKEKLNGSIESLRRQLAASRDSLQLRVDQGYLSVSDIVLTEQDGRELSADGAYHNVRRVLLPNYEKRGWTLYMDLSYAQLRAYIDKRELLLRPEEPVMPNDLNWAPAITAFVRKDGDAEAFVGVWDFSASNVAGMISVITGENSTKTLAGMPVGMTAHMFAAVIVATDKSEKMKVKAFSAKEDAFYMAAVTPDKEREYEVEVLVTEHGGHFFCAFSVCFTKDALDPMRREASEWIKQLRIVGKGRAAIE
jgi:hypothetical protein